MHLDRVTTLEYDRVRRRSHQLEQRRMSNVAQRTLLDRREPERDRPGGGILVGGIHGLSVAAGTGNGRDRRVLTRGRSLSSTSGQREHWKRAKNRFHRRGSEQ